MPPVIKIISNLLHGKCSFCCLCFNIDIKIVSHREVVVLIDETEQKLALSDILLSVFGNEMKDYVSAFEDILCEDCLNSITSIYTYIQNCRNNARILIQTLDRLNNTLGSIEDDNEDRKSLFISIDLKNKTKKFIYDDKKIDSTTTAVKRYNLLQTAKILGAQINNSEKPKNTVKLKLSDMMLDPNNGLPSCKECLKTYPSLYNLKNHFLRVHAPKHYKIKCTKCSRAFSSPTLLNYHLSIEHCKFICSECGKTFNSKTSFLRHDLSHSFQIVCPDCGRMYKNTKSYKKHIKTNVCQRESRANPADAVFTCDYCGKKYTQKISLRVHIQHVHGNYKSHVCKWCGKKFWAQSRLKAHIVKHTKEKKFTCSICQGKFVTKESLLYHTRLHTGEKPYRCSQCDCAFISSSRRAYHIKTYHLKAMVECDVCHSKFSSRSYLNKHKKYSKECQNRQNIDNNAWTDVKIKFESHEKKKSVDNIDENNASLVKLNSSKEVFSKNVS